MALRLRQIVVEEWLTNESDYRPFLVSENSAFNDEATAFLILPLNLVMQCLFLQPMPWGFLSLYLLQCQTFQLYQFHQEIQLSMTHQYSWHMI